MALRGGREEQRAAREALALAAQSGDLRLPDAVRRMRQAMGLSQEDFGRVFHLTRRQVSELETGKGDPKISTLNRLARVFGFTVGFVPKEPQQS
ncbi:helix-turn-helix domain-containing protein [Azospirillum brasilense]|nr:helix-turn-helix domain-containing protein [Azospirillum brasilense]